MSLRTQDPGRVWYWGCSTRHFAQWMLTEILIWNSDFLFSRKSQQGFLEHSIHVVAYFFYRMQLTFQTVLKVFEVTPKWIWSMQEGGLMKELKEIVLLGPCSVGTIRATSMFLRVISSSVEPHGAKNWPQIRSTKAYALTVIMSPLSRGPVL